MRAVRQAVLLVGGLGTRLQHRFPDLPKALVPIAGKPFLDWQLDWLLTHGIDRIHLAAGHRAEQLKTWIGTRSITMSVETEPLGTGGALKLAESYLDDGAFFVINGDTLTPNLDLASMRADSGHIALAVTQVVETSRYGAVEFDTRYRMTSMKEKGASGPGWVNAGVFLADPSIFQEIEPHGFISTEKTLFPKWIKQTRLIAFPIDPPLLDMGTDEGFDRTEAFLKNTK